MHNWLEKTAENGHFRSHLQRGFRYGCCCAALAKWPPKRAVSRVSESWQSHVVHGQRGSAVGSAVGRCASDHSGQEGAF